MRQLRNILDKYSRKIFHSNILGARAEGGGGEAAIEASKSSPWRFTGLYSPTITSSQYDYQNIPNICTKMCYDLL